MIIRISTRNCLRTVPGASPGVVAAALVLALGIASWRTPAFAADLFLTGEREIYLAIDKLNAMGRLDGFLANTRPYSVAAVRTVLEKNPGASSGAGLDSQLARWVAWSTKASGTARATASAAASEKRVIPDNEGGVPIPKGVSLGLSALAREASSPNLSAHASGVYWLGEGDDRGALLGETALEMGLPYISLQAGKIATWYGPGRRGSLIFTNNARSYPGVRLHNPVPIPVPGIFSFLGSVQYDLFVAVMEEDAPIPNSRLSGMRLAARPNRYLEIGLSRAIHYGGDGQANGLSAWWDAFKGTGDNDQGSAGNQIAGFDAEITLPFKAFPVQLYLEMAGEDEAKIVGTVPGPTKWAYVGGVFLPALFGNPAYDLRVEYADNHIGGDGGSWYTHSGGYAHFYHGQCLGHPMGTDARDLTVQAHWFLLPSTYLELTFSRADRFYPGPELERTDRLSVGMLGWLTEKVRAEGEFAWEKVQNPGGSPGEDARDATVRVALSYQTGWGR